jgi:hypothetical protein
MYPSGTGDGIPVAEIAENAQALLRLSREAHHMERSAQRALRKLRKLVRETQLLLRIAHTLLQSVEMLH